MSLAFRPVNDGDQELLLALYASTRMQELALVPWTAEQKQAFVRMQAEAQRRHYETYYPKASHQIVLWEGAEVGRLWVDQGADGIHVLDLIVRPEARGRGIGTAVLRALQAEGAAAGQPVWGYLESWSPAVPLLARLGFTKGEEQGAHHEFRWLPTETSGSSECGIEGEY